jgi:polysaccharide export outer membrane protein
MVTVCLLAIGVGCSGTREELVEVPAQQEDWSTPSDLAALEADSAVRDAVLPAPTVVVPEPAVVDSPIIELTEQAEPPLKDLKDHVRAAKRMLREGNLETAAILLGEALRLDPTSKPARALQERLEHAQRETQEKARRELIRLYQREGQAILEDGDVGLALAYFQAAQDLDPENRKIFKRIQGAHARWDAFRTKQREQQFKERLRRVAADLEVPGDEVAVEPIGAILSGPEMPAQPVAQTPQPTSASALTAAVEPTVEVASSPAHEIAVTSATTGASEYTVQPEDVLQITVYEEPDLTTKARVASSGEMTFPLLGRVPVAALTVTQVQEKLTTLLAEDYLVNPQVQVFVDTGSSNPRKVVVTGAVNKPGSYAIPAERPTNLIEAIALAGGFSEEAAPNSTRIVRVEDGQQQTIRVRANDVITKGDKTQDVVVRPNDIVFVPESFF